MVVIKMEDIRKALEKGDLEAVDTWRKGLTPDDIENINFQELNDMILEMIGGTIIGSEDYQKMIKEGDGVMINPFEIDIMPPDWPPYRANSIMQHERNIWALNEWVDDVATPRNMLDLHCQADILYMETGIWIDVYDFFSLREAGGDYFWLDETEGGLNEEWTGYAEKYGSLKEDRL